EGSGADGNFIQLATVRLNHFFGDDRARVTLSQHRQERRIRALQVEDDRVIVGRVDGVQQGKLPRARRTSGGIFDARERVFHVGGLELAAVVELDSLAQFERVLRLAIGGVRLRQVRLNLQLFVEAQQATVDVFVYA